MRYTMIIPPKYETALTGMILAGEKQIIRRGIAHVYRIEAYPSGLRLHKDSKTVKWDDLCRVGRALAHEIATRARELVSMP